jgi:chorismate mutase
MAVRGIRGAIDVAHNHEEDILAATSTLLQRIVQENNLSRDDIACVYFTVTPDLDAVYPARAAREMGWIHVPLMCAQEMTVKGSLERCIRVLVLWNTLLTPEAVQHVYLDQALSLRPDLVLK